ncbi:MULTISPECIES: sporulation protein [Actinosynnema]|uniref:sporulation protein n=1 Tax=Actinosynnema TaxID=40566 RepID=UPI0020A580D0|nr:sporulation protein [Actinosynnema pretiosum]MCP2098804.1 sporulation-control protein [Actinosynnema pretiosum]
MFKRMLSAWGVGGPTAETTLTSPHTTPGQVLSGEVRLRGGVFDAEVAQLVLSLVVATGNEDVELVRVIARQGLAVPAGSVLPVHFQLRTPWETPITALGGAPLPGVSVGVRTEVVLDGPPGRVDRRVVLTGPAPSQERVLDAFDYLGFRFQGTGVGQAPGALREPALRDPALHQEFRFLPPSRFAGVVDEIALTLVADADGLLVLIGADQRRTGRFRVSPEAAGTTDWNSLVELWAAQAVPSGRGAGPR